VSKKRRLPVGDDLGIDWERWADGRTWRLKRKRDFPDVDPHLVGDAAATAALRMGRAVMTTKDRYYPDKFVWLQFADHQVAFGEPCPCGSRRLMRLHPNFARCPECRADLILSEDEREVGPAATLRRMSDVHLTLMDSSNGRELYRGYARRRGEQYVLLIVELTPAEEGENGQSVDKNEVLARAQKTRFVPFDQLEGLLDVDKLLNREGSHWDLVF
jgi:hypothetical protein